VVEHMNWWHPNWLPTSFMVSSGMLAVLSPLNLTSIIVGTHVGLCPSLGVVVHVMDGRMELPPNTLIDITIQVDKWAFNATLPFSKR